MNDQGGVNNVLMVPDKGGLDGADMENLAVVHGSPQVFVKLDKTPTMIDGRLEMFGNIGSMIEYWEGLEEKETEKEILASVKVNDGLKSKRLSQVVKKLSGIFEEGSRDDIHKSGGSEGEGANNISFIDGVHLRNSQMGKVENVINAYSANLSDMSN